MAKQNGKASRIGEDVQVASALDALDGWVALLASETPPQDRRLLFDLSFLAREFEHRARGHDHLGAFDTIMRLEGRVRSDPIARDIAQLAVIIDALRVAVIDHSHGERSHVIDGGDPLAPVYEAMMAKINSPRYEYEDNGEHAGMYVATDEDLVIGDDAVRFGSAFFDLVKAVRRADSDSVEEDFETFEDCLDLSGFSGPVSSAIKDVRSSVLQPFWDADRVHREASAKKATKRVRRKRPMT